jgi:hypothetical protein
VRCRSRCARPALELDQRRAVVPRRSIGPVWRARFAALPTPVGASWRIRTCPHS